MPARQRIQAMDWRCFGQRNHMMIVRKESFETQFDTAAAHNARKREVEGSFTRLPATRATEMSLRDLAKSCRSRSSHFVPGDSFCRNEGEISQYAQVKRESLNVNRGRRSGWDSQAMEIYTRSRNVSPEASPLGSPLSRMSPLQVLPLPPPLHPLGTVP